MFVVGLSGGIGSGKTVASDHFASLGINVVDTDVIAREVVAKGSPTLNQLVSEFGDSILLDNGELNRDALRKLAFSSPNHKAKLDAITHPTIRLATIQQVQDSKTPYCIVVVHLLTADSPFQAFMQRVLIVTADNEIKIERVKKTQQSQSRRSTQNYGQPTKRRRTHQVRG